LGKRENLSDRFSDIDSGQKKVLNASRRKEKMIKKQQKWIALLVVCTFLWLMQVSTMPVAAAGTTEQLSSASAEQGPDYYEAVSQKAAPAKKKSMLPIILIGVGLVAVTAAVLFLVVLKNKYDIRGTWKFEYLELSGAVWYTMNATFAGTKESGTVTSVTGSISNYTVVDKTVSWPLGGGWALHTATFTDKDTISGTWDWGGGYDGNFRATRISGAAVDRNLAGNGGHTPPSDGK
jgi:hypothetical protein